MSTNISVLSGINRLNPRAVSQSTISGIIAYGCRQNVLFIDVRSNPPILLESKNLFPAHSDRIVAVSFSKSPSIDFLATIGEDWELKVWDLETRTCFSKQPVREFTRVVEWIYGSTNTLIYPAEGKSIAKLNIKTNKLVKIKTGSEIAITIMASCEISPHIVAIGHSNGTISVLNIVQEKLLHVLKSHSMELTSLSWSRISYDTLLSASLDLTIRLWNINEDKPFQTYYVPASRQKYDDKKKVHILGLCHPTNPDAIICVNFRGEIGEVVFKENEKPRFSSYCMDNNDNCRFPFAMFTINADHDNQRKELLCCVDSQKITVMDVKEKKLFTHIPFMKGFIYDITNSNVNPDLLAISNGDGILRIWNSLAQGSKLDMTSVYVHYRTKIMIAAFHPTIGNLLAFATDEGKVGTTDIYKRKSINWFETYHRGSVYSLTWAPCKKISEEEDQYYLYSCGSGIIFINKPNDYNSKAVNFDDLVERPSDMESSEKTWTEIKWKPDYTCVCVGTFKGFIDIFDPKFVFLARYTVQMKSVECLCWHPESTFVSPKGSPLKFWLACAGSDVDIHIFDVAKIFEDNTEKLHQDAVVKLVGHKKRVVSLCWSHHDDGFLASGSRDTTVLVWNVHSGNVIATYAEHRDVIYTIFWSMYDKDAIYSGGQDGSVRMWKISQQEISAPPDKVPNRKKMKKSKFIEEKKNQDFRNSASENSTLENNSEPLSAEHSVETETLLKEMEHEDLKGPSVHENTAATSFQDQAGKTTKISAYSARRACPLFPQYYPIKISENAEDLSDCMKLADILSEKQCSKSEATTNLKSFELSNEDIIKFGPFTDKLTALKMLRVQEENFKSAGNAISSYHLGLMASNVKSLIEEAAENGNLSEYLVSLSPSVSYGFWLQMCNKFALQLIDENQYYMASMYLLICGKLYEAIDILTQKGNIIDAIILAKAHLPETDPVIETLLHKAARKYANLAHNILQAKCQMALKEPLVAAKLLSSAGGANYTRVAAYICKKFNLEKEARQYSFLCMEKCLSECDWSCFQLLLDQEPEMQIYKSLVTVHESFYLHIRQLKKRDALSGVFLTDASLNKVKIWKGSACISSEQSFIEHVYHLLLSKSLLPAEESSCKEMLNALKLLATKMNNFASSQAHVTIAIAIMEFILLSMRDSHSTPEVLLKIFAAAHNILFLPKIVCSLLLPIELYWCRDMNTFDMKTIVAEDTESDIKPVLMLQNIWRTIGEKITCYQNQPLQLTTTVDKESLCNLSGVMHRTKALLTGKKLEDFILAYFISSIATDLMRSIIKKGIKIKCSALSVTENVKTTEIEAAIEANLEDEKNYENENVNVNFKEEPITDCNISSCDRNGPSENGNDNFSKLTVEEVNSPSQINMKYETETHCINHDESLLHSSEMSLADSNNSNNSDLHQNDMLPKNNKHDEYLLPSSEMSLADSNNSNNSDLHQNDMLPKNNEHSEAAESVVNEESPDLQELIELALNEANEKLNSFKEKRNEKETNQISLPIENLSGILGADSSSNNKHISDTTKTKSSSEDNVSSGSWYSVDENISGDSNCHIECLKSIDIWFNVVSFITVNICKDEYALRYYLKECLHTLNKTLASETLSKFVKESKSEFNTEGKKKCSSKSNVDTNFILNGSADVVKEQNLNENGDPIVTNAECAVNKDSNFSTQLLEQSNYDTESRPKNNNLNEAHENVNSDKASQNHINKHVDHNYASQIDNELSEGIPHPINEIKNIPIIESNADTINMLKESENFINGQYLNENGDIIATNVECTISKDSKFPSELLEKSNHDTESSCKQNSFNEALENVNSDKALQSINNHMDNNYVSQIDNKLSEESTHSINELKGIPVTEVGDTNGHLQSRLLEITELLHILEDVPQVSYPNPFEVIAKVLKTLDHVLQECQCSLIQEKLHQFIHEIISWTDKYSTGDINFKCEHCLKRNTCN